MEKTAVVVGSGNVALHLTRALMKAGVQVLMIYSRTAANALDAGRLLGVPATSIWSEIPTEASFYFYAVSDNALNELLARDLAPAAVHIHTAGSISMDVFGANKPYHGVLYPLQTFSKNKELDFRQVPLFVEASSSGVLLIISELAASIAGSIYEISSSQRMQLHLAAVYACNFVNHMYTIAGDLVKLSGLPFVILRPLIAETASKIEFISPAEAQTGPAVRRDTSVMNKHMELLNNHPNYKEIYQLLSDSISSKK